MPYLIFCQRFSPEDSSEIMHLPNSFLSKLGGRLPEKGILMSNGGRLWHVEICDIDDRTCFCNGWKQFTMDNSLRDGSVVIFSFDGNNIFRFRLLGPDGQRVVQAPEREEYEETDPIAKREEDEDDEEGEEDEDEDEDY